MPHQQLFLRDVRLVPMLDLLPANADYKAAINARVFAANVPAP